MTIVKFYCRKDKKAKALIGNESFRKYLLILKSIASINERIIGCETKFDCKEVPTSSTDYFAEKVGLKYKELWRIEKLFW